MALIDEERLASNISTETYQPHYGHTVHDSPEDPGGAVGVLSIIRRGPTGVGASFSFTEPTPAGWHDIHGAEPLVSRPVGA